MLRRLFAVVPAVVVLSACPAKVASIEVAPAKLSFDAEAASKPLTATLKDADGAAIEQGDKVIAWTSKDPAVATVDANGAVRPAGSGTTIVTAAYEEVSGTAAVDVVLLKRIQLQSPAMVLVVGTPSDALALNFMNERGEPIAIDAEKGPKWPIVWKTADPAIASVNEKGVVTPVSPGSTTLTVEANELKAEMTITVNPAPEAAAGVDGAAPPAEATKK